MWGYKKRQELRSKVKAFHSKRGYLQIRRTAHSVCKYTDNKQTNHTNGIYLAQLCIVNLLTSYHNQEDEHWGCEPTRVQTDWECKRRSGRTATSNLTARVENWPNATKVHRPYYMVLKSYRFTLKSNRADFQ